MITSVIRPQRNSIWVAATAHVLPGYLITKKDTAVYSFEESNQLRKQKERAALAFIFTCMELCFVALPKGRAGVTLLLQHRALRLERLQRNIQTKYKHHLPLWYFLSNYLELLYHYSEACVQQHVAGKEWEEKNERERKRKGATLHTHTACPIYIYTIQKQIWQLHNGPLACFVRLFLSLYIYFFFPLHLFSARLHIYKSWKLEEEEERGGKKELAGSSSRVCQIGMHS